MYMDRCEFWVIALCTVHVCACTCMCMYVHICTCMCMYVHVCACMYMYVHKKLVACFHSKLMQ